MIQARVSKFFRRIGAAYAVIFLAAATAAPHRHLNGIEDLLSDGPSDSGAVLVERVSRDAGGPLIAPLRLLDDDPCLACFPHDFVAAAACVFVLPGPSASLASNDAAPRPSVPRRRSRPPSSRSPPASF
jgi:hypothetical protein